MRALLLPTGSSHSLSSDQLALLGGVLLSLVLHGALLLWWLASPVYPPQERGIEQAVTVDLLAPTPAAGERMQPPMVIPPTEPPAPDVLQKDEMAEQHTVVKKQSEKKQRPVIKPLAAPTPDDRALPPASTDAPAHASPAPAPTTSARYDAAYLHNPAPSYPQVSRRMGEQGKVLLAVKVSTDGLALSVTVKQSSGFARLDEAAVRATTQWRFVPAKQGDIAIVSWVDVPVQFSLHK